MDVCDEPERQSVGVQTKREVIREMINKEQRGASD